MPICQPPSRMLSMTLSVTRRFLQIFPWTWADLDAIHDFPKSVLNVHRLQQPLHLPFSPCPWRSSRTLYCYFFSYLKKKETKIKAKQKKRKHTSTSHQTLGGAGEDPDSHSYPNTLAGSRPSLPVGRGACTALFLEAVGARSFRRLEPQRRFTTTSKSSGAVAVCRAFG